MTGSVVVSWNFPEKDEDRAILIVGRKKPGKVAEVINAFQGKEAKEIYERLTKKER